MQQLTLSIIQLLVSGVVFSLLLQRLKRNTQRELQALRELHRKQFEEAHRRVHHAGPVPPGTRILGIADLLSRALSKIIVRLQKQQEKQDFNMIYCMRELSELKEVELRMLEKSVNEYITEIRKNAEIEYEENKQS